MNEVFVVLIYLLQIVLNALSDGYNQLGMKRLGHLLYAVSLGLLIALPFFGLCATDHWWYIIVYLSGYSFLRLSVFDVIINIVRHKHWYYHCNRLDKTRCSFEDGFWSGINPPPVFEAIGRVLIFAFGIFTIINGIL